MKVILRFEGLCGFAHIDGQSLAIMPTTMGHRPVLTVRATDLRIDETDTPDLIGHTELGQFAAFNLHDSDVGFQDATGIADFSSPGERAKTIDLGEHHPDQIGKLKRVGCAVKLPEGTLTAGPDDPVKFKFKFGSVSKERSFAASIDWAGTIDETDVLWVGDRKVTLKEKAVPNPPTVVIHITNVAPVQGQAALHFTHYYDMFKSPPTVQVSISHQGVDDYDCVPPAPLPGP